MPLYMWKRLQVCLTLLLLKLYAYEICCPSLSHTMLREQVFCSTTFPYYMCLLDANKQQYKEICRKEDEVQSKGYKTEIRGGFDRVLCNPNRYQPFEHSTKIGANCSLLKSFCNDEGQIVFDDGSSQRDISCRCDYTEGYDFVTPPSERCFCMPTIEDCSCYTKHCERNEILTPDYECKTVDSLSGHFYCQDINGFEHGLATGNKISGSTAIKGLTQKERTVIGIISLLVGIIIGICITAACRWYQCFNRVPEISIECNRYDALYGSKIELISTFNSEIPCSDVFWMKHTEHGSITVTNEMPDIEGSTVTNPSLTLCSPMIEDSGEYVCCVVNKYGKACSRPIKLKVNGGVPEIFIQGNSYDTLYGSKIELVCTFISQIECSDVYWLKHTVNGTLKVTHTMPGIEGSTVTNPSLTLCSPMEEDSGEYVCYVVNKYGIACSQPIKLNVKGGVPEISIERNRYDALYGSKIELKITFNSEIPCSDVFWMNHTEHGSIKVTNKMPDIEGSTVTNPSLTLCSPMIEDSGEYVCYVVNKCGTAFSRPIKLHVNGGVPEIIIKCNSYDTLYGSKIELVCTFISQIECSDVYWLKHTDNGTLKITHAMPGIEGSTVTNPSLTLCSPMKEHSGEYVCCVVNKCGTACSQPMNIKVIGDVPEISVECNRYDTLYGFEIKLMSTFKSQTPCSDVYWLKHTDNGSIRVTNEMHDIEGSTVANPSLTLCSPMIEDSGEYVCCVVNKCGTACSRPIRLNVNGDVPITCTPENNSYYPDIGERVLISCKIEANPPCTKLVWKKFEDDEFTTIKTEFKTGPLQQNITSSLLFNNVADEEYGEYFCFATNDVGTSRSKAIYLIYEYTDSEDSSIFDETVNYVNLPKIASRRRSSKTI